MPNGKQHLSIQKGNSGGSEEISCCYLPHMAVGQCGDILTDAFFRHTFGILAQNHAIQTKATVSRLDNNMGGLSGFLNGTGEGKGDDVGTVCVADIVLKNNTGAPAILFAATSSKVHQIYFPNLRDSLLIMMKTQGTNSFNSIMLIVGV